MEVVDEVMPEGFRVVVILAELALAVTETVPVNPSLAVTFIVDVPFPPAAKLSEEGVAVRLKSGAVTVTITTDECDREPLTPVIVTL